MVHQKMEIQTDIKVEEFIRSLEKLAIAKVVRTIDLLETFGNNLGMPHSKKVAEKLFELRISGRQEIRIFYTFHKGSACLLHGFIKKSRKTPQRELNNALARLSRSIF